ncbi:DUF3696 domain-containing protein [Vibrio splendidus]
MLENLKIKDLRSIKEMDLDLKYMTILTGLNSSGKSTIIGALNLLNQADNDRIKLNGDYVNFGKIENLLYNWRDGDDKATIEYNFSENNEKLEISTEFSIYNLITDEEISNQFKNPNSNPIRYLSSDRLSPDWSFDVAASSYKTRDLGAKGQNSIAYLCQVTENQTFKNSPEVLFVEGLAHETLERKEDETHLISNINAWLSVISPGVSIKTEHLRDINKTKLSYSLSTIEGMTPFSVGFGLTHCLPIILMILTAKKGDILVIENPELNLHPEGQLQIGRLIAKAAAQDIQVIVETHSDHVVNAARICVKDGTLPLEKLAIKFLQIEKENIHRVTSYQTKDYSVTVLANGKLKEPPSGFFDTWKKSLLELM